MGLFVCGDTHGFSSDFRKIRNFNKEHAKELTKDDVLVQLGDAGWIWYALGTNKEQEYWLNWLATRKYIVAVVPGNHENYDEIFKLPLTEKWGGKARYLESKGRFGEGVIYFLERGEIYTIDGKTIWCFGGALSIDKDDRTLGINYWEQELPTWTEFEHGMNQLDSVNWTVDYIFTHTCPLNIVGDIIHRTPYTEGKFKDPVAEFLYEVYKKIDVKEWHFGHFHEDRKLDYSLTNDGIFQCHYENPPLRII